MWHFDVTLLYKVRDNEMAHAPAYYCIGLSTVNGSLLYKRHAFQNEAKKVDIISLIDFHIPIALSLLQENKLAAKIGRPKSDNTPTV